MAYLRLLLVLIFSTKCACALRTDCTAKVDLSFLDEMIDSQLVSSCAIKVELMDEQNLSYCYKRGAIIALQILFEHLKFKEGSESFKNISLLQSFYNYRLDNCIIPNGEDIQRNEISACLRTTYLSPPQILEKFKEYFGILQDFDPKKESDEECLDFFDKCDGLAASKGGSLLSIPSTIIREINSSSNDSSVPPPSTHFTENISVSYSPSSERLEFSSLALTNTPAEVQTMTTTMDHGASTKHLGLTPKTPVINTGPANSGPSPTTPNFSSTYSPKSKSESEIISSSNTSSVSSTSTLFTEDMSDSYSQSPQQSSESIEFSSLVLTNMPAEVQPVTALMDHVGSPEHLSLTPETPISSSSNASSVPSTSTLFTENTSDSYSQSPQQSTESIELSYLVLTNIPAEVQPMTTIMDHVASTEHVGLTPKTPIINRGMANNGEEFPKSRTESAYTTNVSPTKTYHTYNTESSNKDGLQTENRPTTTEGSKLYGEIILVRKTSSKVDESTDTGSINSATILQQDYTKHSMEHDIDTLTSAVTKVQGSVENVMDTRRTYLSTHAPPFLSTEGSASDPPHLTFSHAGTPPNFESLKTSPQEKPNDARNLGWAFSYLNSASLTAKPLSSKLAVPSLHSEIMPSLSETSLPTAYKGGHMHGTYPQQEKDIGLISVNTEHRLAGPDCGSNPLPIIATEQRDDEANKHMRSNLYLVVVPSILAIVFFCGLLYVLYRYRLLTRQLAREHAHLPEQRPLNFELQDV